MNAVQEYLAQTGIRQADLARLLQEKVDPRIDQALVSKMNQGVCLPSEAITECLCASMHWPSERFLEDSGVIYREDPEAGLKSEIWAPLIEALAGSSWSEPRSRSYLASRLGMRDRSVRRLKELATQDGVIIGSSSHGRGYYLCQTREDLLRLRGEYTSRIKSLSKTVRAIDRDLSRLPGQEEIKL